MSLVTYLDDFYSGFSYIGNWITPDTSLNSYTSFSNPSYFDGTYHSTTTTNDVVSLNFTGTAITVYGAAQAISAVLDSNLIASPTNGSRIIFSATNLANGAHFLSLKNTGGSLLVDYATIVNPQSFPTAGNVTIEDDSKLLSYKGSWSSNNDTRFSGNTSTYTNQNQGSVSLNFTGATVYVYGDTVNDHGPFNVTLDGKNSIFEGKTEYLKIGTLKYFATGLTNQSHTLIITNLGTTFFDVDCIVYTSFAVVPASSSSITNSSSNPTTTSSIPKSTTSDSNRLKVELCVSLLLFML